MVLEGFSAILSKQFLILIYSLNNLHHWFKLNRDKVLNLLLQNSFPKLTKTIHKGHCSQPSFGPHAKIGLRPSCAGRLEGESSFSQLFGSQPWRMLDGDRWPAIGRGHPNKNQGIKSKHESCALALRFETLSK
jgi:hypothetical protein